MLVIDHFSELYQLLWNVRSKYESFGCALDLLPDDVSAIKQTHQSDTDRCFNAVLTEVLNQGVTQENLAKALESGPLGYVQLAKELRNTIFHSRKPHVVYGQPFCTQFFCCASASACAYIICDRI